jgi:hypothetical protein
MRRPFGVTTSAPAELLAEGIFRAPYLVDGRPAFIAVDASGNLVATAPAALGEDAASAVEWLEGVLAHAAPAVPAAPQLVLLQGGAR